MNALVNTEDVTGTLCEVNVINADVGVEADVSLVSDFFFLFFIEQLELVTICKDLKRKQGKGS